MAAIVRDMEGHGCSIALHVFFVSKGISDSGHLATAKEGLSRLGHQAGHVGDGLQVETTKEWGEDNKRWNLFITRFYDCELCDTGRGKEPLSKCHKSYLEHYDFAFCRFHRCA